MKLYLPVYLSTCFPISLSTRIPKPIATRFMSTTITPERPDTVDALQLINELEEYLAPQYPVESRHGFSPEKLIRQNVAVFVMRQDGVAAGCGGIKI